MINAPNIDRINQRLALHYGANLIGQPYFRIVWSEDQREKRFGKFGEFYGKIFLREFHGLREVPKYSYMGRKWVLERWIPPVYAHTPDIPETSQGSYEPIYVFQDAQGNPLEVVEVVADRIIWTLFHPKLPGARKSEMETEDQKALEKEIELSKMVMENQSPYLAGKIHGQEAIIVPRNYGG